MKKLKIITKNKTPIKRVNKNPPLIKREYVEIPITEFEKNSKVKIICGVIYLKEFPTQPFVSHHFKNA